jgi:hypothetical protein
MSRSIIEISEQGMKISTEPYVQPEESKPKVNISLEKVTKIVKEKRSHTPKTAKVPSMGGPPGLNCYICGRKYGTRSLEIHIK